MNNTILSVVQQDSVRYPDSRDFFSPSSVYPEYKFDHLAAQPNPVYKAVRDVFVQARLDHIHLDTPEWNPLGTFVRKGSKVFVLCNFVAHKWQTESQKNFISKVTHGSVLRAIIDYLLIAVGDEGKVCFGNAPIQSTRFEKVLSQSGAQDVLEFYKQHHKPVDAVDLRFFIANRSSLGTIKNFSQVSDNEGILINLNSDSLLVGLPKLSSSPFRVAEYSPDRTEKFHEGGNHIYVINRHIVESDVIFSIPKLKVHQKVGVTLSLKGCVGIVGHKDCLAHHRFGSPSIGGDEYPDSSLSSFLHLISRFHDHVHKSDPKTRLGNVLRVLDKNIHRVLRVFVPVRFGAWWGNDTCWRMTLDLARVVAYGTERGMSDSIQRRHLVLIDGIVGGEGNGPLRPDAVHSGLLIFSDNPVVADYAGTLLMGFDPNKIPLLRQASQLSKYPIHEQPIEIVHAIYNGEALDINYLKNKVQYAYRPSIGWKGHIEMQGNGQGE